jgi:hypothetical protein
MNLGRFLYQEKLFVKKKIIKIIIFKILYNFRWLTGGLEQDSL